MLSNTQNLNWWPTDKTIWRSAIYDI